MKGSLWRIIRKSLPTHLSQQILFQIVILDQPPSAELPDLAIQVLLLTTSHALGLDSILEKAIEVNKL